MPLPRLYLMRIVCLEGDLSRGGGLVGATLVD